MHERLVLCGDQIHKTRLRGQRLVLKLTGDDANINLKIPDIRRRLLADIPDLLEDLLEIATYVLAADAATDRGDLALSDMGDDWRRRFRFVIPVRRPEVWASRELTGLLTELLRFLSEDEHQFEFVKLERPTRFDSYLDLRNPVGGDERADEVVLFSGGLDSLAGAVEDLLGRQKRVVLVSHHSSSKLRSRQGVLADALEQKARDRVLHVPIRMTKRTGLTVEYSQRSRSFFFIALGAVVARIVGTNRVRLYENGIISLNLPLAENVIGARATRSTHPTVVAGVNQLLASLFDEPITVDNPYALLTKTEVVKRIETSDCADLIPLTVSCSRVYQIETDRPHCGECSQCLGRRFAILSGGLEQHDPEHGYRVRLFVDERREGTRRALAVSYIELARELCLISDTEFLRRFGVELSRALADMPGDRKDNLALLLELHRRFGSYVTAAVAEAFRQHAQELAEGKLPEHCLLRLVAAPDDTLGEVDHAGEEAPLPASEAGQPRIGADSLFDPESVKLALDHRNKRVVIEGLQPLSGAQMFPLFKFLVDLRDEDVAQRRRDESYSFAAREMLADDLGCDEDGLRALIYRTRQRICKAAEEAGAPALSQNAIIEGKRSSGYRLSLAVQVIALSEICR